MNAHQNNRFPTEADQDLQGRLASFLDLLKGTIVFAGGHNIGAGSAAAALKALLPRAQRAVRASKRPICVGLFGESQVGKSFLVSELARGSDDRLYVVDPEIQRGIRPDPEKKRWVDGKSDGHIDFLNYINPEEKTESTAVICRFTRASLLSPIRGDTIIAQVLSHRSLLRSLVQGFVAECAWDADDEDSLQPQLQIWSDLLSRAPIGQNRRSDFVWCLEEIWSYVKANHRSHPYYALLLKSEVLDQLSDIADIPDPMDRFTIATMLWGGSTFAPLGRVYRIVLSALGRLRFASHIEVPIEVVARGTEGPVYAKLLSGLLDDGREKIPVLARPENDDPVAAELTVPELCAVISELHLPIMRLTATEHDLLDKADILDFPGAKSHKVGHGYRPRNLEGAEGNEAVGAILKRGKLTCLFEHFCEEREVTVLLLCLSIGKYEVAVLPKQILHWIATRYPGYPELRKKDALSPSHFVVMTQFDRFLEPREAKSRTRQNFWSNYFDEIVRHLEGTISRKWFSEWYRPKEESPPQPFNNVYWVFNPLKCAGWSNIKKHLQAAFDEYMRSELVKKYIRDPRRHWQSAASFENPGTAFLREAVFRKLSPELKRSELVDELHALVSAAINILDVHHTPEDGTGRKRKARHAADRLITELKDNLRMLTFGPLLKKLLLDAALVDEVLDVLEKGDPEVEDFVDRLVDVWLRQMLATLEDPTVATALRIGPSSLSTLVEELAIRAHGDDFRTGLIDSLRFFFQSLLGVSFYRHTIRQVCSKQWNDFVLTLGSEIAVPVMPTLPPKLSYRRPFDRWFAHWQDAVPRMYEENTGLSSELPAWNEDLGGLLTELKDLKKSIDH